MLHVQDELVSSVVEGLLYSLTVADPALKGCPLVYVSPGFETLSGYGAEELLGGSARVLQVRAGATVWQRAAGRVGNMDCVARVGLGCRQRG